MNGTFALGRWIGGSQLEEGQPARIPADRFTTHAVVIGMTGSGKTGLVIDILEEAALAGIPALVIDPKGDLTNRTLVFPEFAPEAFAPFCPEGRAPEAARRWKEGLATWGLGDAQATALAAQPVRVYTPGSSVNPLNVLDRFSAPAPGDPEAAHDKALASTASLFALAEVEANPATSPEGLLTAQLLLNAWGSGAPLSLEALVQQVLNPPISKIGVMDLSAVFPAKDRTAFAMKLNALLASPALSEWRLGPPVDLDAFLGKQAGASQTILTLAHLSDQERLFFLGLLLGDLAAWVRRQPGSDSLRALVVFDEVYGFFPPHPANPPTKTPLLTLLKQARAFGVGLVLATQNPVDIDYKGLTNAGLWFLGRLQTEPDRARVADALGALPGGTRAAGLLGDLKPRTFVVHDVKEASPRILESRQCISYLAGPLTPPQLKGLLGTPDIGAAATSAEAVAGDGENSGMRDARGSSPAPQLSSSPAPVLPAGWSVAFGPGARLAPHLEVEAEIAYKPGQKAAPILVRKHYLWPLLGSTLEHDLAGTPGTAVPPLQERPAPGALLDPLPGYFGSLEAARAGRAAAASLAMRQVLTVKRDAVTGALQEPAEGEEAFQARVSRLREASWRAEGEKTLAPLTIQVERAEDRVRRLELKVGADKSDAGARTTETALSAGLGVLGGIFGSRRSLGGAISRTASKVRQMNHARDKAEADASDLDDARRELAEFKARVDDARSELVRQMAGAPLESVSLVPAKSGVQVLSTRLLWIGPG